MPITLPNPSQAGQAPSGELNENILSLGSSKVMPSASNRVEKSYVMLDGINKILQVPCPS